MMYKLECDSVDELFDAVLSLKSREECYAFFEDMCTIKELQDMAQRFNVAKLLSEGTVYGEIQARTGASTATISRVNKCLNYGSDGYRTVLARIKK